MNRFGPRNNTPITDKSDTWRPLTAIDKIGIFAPAAIVLTLAALNAFGGPSDKTTLATPSQASTHAPQP